MNRETLLQIARECGAILLGTEPLDDVSGIVTLSTKELEHFARRMQAEALRAAATKAYGHGEEAMYREFMKMAAQLEKEIREGNEDLPT